MFKKETRKAFVADVKKNEEGFSLVEVVIAMVVMLVALLGVFGAFIFAVKFNAGNSWRSQALSVLQKEVELIRSAKYTPTITDNYTPADQNDNRRDLVGGTKAPRFITAIDGVSYKVETFVDNDPVTVGVQSANESTTNFKEITITVTPQATNGNWVIGYPVTAVFSRVRSN
jgi:prepilin-type N-terminal cleavage/methylation domain-containing protein